MEYFEQKWSQIPFLKARIKIFFVDIKGRHSANMVSTSFLMNSVGDTLSLHPSVLSLQHSSAIRREKATPAPEGEALVIQMFYSFDKQIQNQITQDPIHVAYSENNNCNSKFTMIVNGNTCGKDQAQIKPVGDSSYSTDGKSVGSGIVDQRGVHEVYNRYFDNKHFSGIESDRIPMTINSDLRSKTHNIRSMNENQGIKSIPDCSNCLKSPLPTDRVLTQVSSIFPSDFSHSLWDQVGNDGISPSCIVRDQESTVLNLFSPIRQYNTLKSENGNSQYYENTLDIIDRVACGLISIEDTSTSTATFLKKKSPFLKCETSRLQHNIFIPCADTRKNVDKNFARMDHFDVNESVRCERQKNIILVPVCDSKECELLIPDVSTKRDLIQSHVPSAAISNSDINMNKIIDIDTHIDINADTNIEKKSDENENSNLSFANNTNLLKQFSESFLLSDDLAAYDLPTESLIMYDGGIKRETNAIDMCGVNVSELFQNDLDHSIINYENHNTCNYHENLDKNNYNNKNYKNNDALSNDIITDNIIKNTDSVRSNHTEKIEIENSRYDNNLQKKLEVNTMKERKMEKKLEMNSENKM